MTCPTEFKCSLYAEGELSEAESRDVRLHLDLCDSCRTLVEAFIDENRLICDVLVGESVTVSGQERLSLYPLVSSVLGIAVFIRIAWTLITDFTVPAALEWLNPLERSGQITLLSSGIQYLVRDVPANLTTLLSSAAILAVSAPLFVLVSRRLRRQAGTAMLGGVMIFLVSISSPAYAAEVRRTGATITIAANETIDNTLVAFGEVIVVDGTVTGDVLAAGRDISIRGTVKGDVIAFGQNVTVTGTVEGNVFGFAETVDVRGMVNRNLYGAAQLVAVSTGGTVRGGASAGAATMNIDGVVGGDVTSFAGITNVHGSIGRNLELRSDRAILFSDARVGGDLNALVRRSESVQVVTGATVAGKQNVNVQPASPSRYLQPSFYVRQLLWLAGAFLAGLLVFRLVPSLGTIRLDTGNAIIRAGGFGFLIAVATPVAAIALAITIIGLPIAFLSLLAWLVALYLAKIVVAQFIGRALVTRGAPALLAGLAAVAVAINVPYVGGIVNVFLTLIGFGAIVLSRPARAG